MLEENLDEIIIKENKNYVEQVKIMLSNQNEVDISFDDDNKLKSTKSMYVLNVYFISFLIIIIYIGTKFHYK